MANLIKSQVIAMVYASYTNNAPDDFNRKEFGTYLCWDEKLVKECPKGSGYDYGMYIGKLIKRYGLPSEIDTTSCYGNWLKCTAEIQGNYFNVCYDPSELFEYVCMPSNLELKILSVNNGYENIYK